MKVLTKTYLKFIEYRNFHLWDVKRYFKRELSTAFPLVSIKNFVIKYIDKVQLDDDKAYKRIRIRAYGKGVELRDIEYGEEIKTKQQFSVKQGQFIFSKIDARNGAFGIVPNELDNAIITNSFSVYDVNKQIANTKYLYLVTKTKYFQDLCEKVSSGTTGRRNISDEHFVNFQIPLPPLSEQHEIVSRYFEKIQKAQALEKEAQNIEQKIEEYFLEVLGIQKQEKRERKKGLQFVEFATLTKWGIDFVYSNTNIKPIYKEYSISQLCKISSGGTPSRSKKEFFENGYIPWIKTGELNNDILLTTSEKITNEALQNSSAKLYKKGSLVIAMYGATIGKTAKLGIDATTNQACAVLFNIDNSKIETNYLWEYLQARTEHLKTLAYGSAQPNLNAGIIANYTIPLPSLPKQQEIVNVIQTKKKTIQSTKNQAKLLKHQAETEFEKSVFL